MKVEMKHSDIEIAQMAVFDPTLIQSMEQNKATVVHKKKQSSRPSSK